MPRDLAAATETALQGSTIRFAYLFKGVFQTEVLALTTLWHDLTYDGTVFKAAGDLVGFEPVQEDLGGQITEANFSLSGLDVNIMSIVLNYKLSGNPIQVWQVLLDTNGNIIGNPFFIFDGISDGGTISETEQSALINLKAANILANFEQSTGRRTNDSDHHSRHPNDNSMEFVSDLVEKQTLWRGA